MEKHARLKRLFVLLLVVCLPALIASVPAAVAAVRASGVTASSGQLLDANQSDVVSQVDVSERYVVASQYNGTDYDIVGWDLWQSPPAKITIAASAANETAPSVDGNVVAWELDGALGFAQIGNQSSGHLIGDVKEPVVHEGKIVFSADFDSDGVYDIYTISQSAAYEQITSRSSIDDTDPDMWKNVMVWQGVDNTGNGEIFLKEKDWPYVYKVHNTVWNAPDERHPSVWGEWIAWESRESGQPSVVIAKNMVTGEEQTFDEPFAFEQGPAVFNDHLLYMSTNDSGACNEVYLVDLVSGEKQQVDQYAPGTQMTEVNTSLSSGHAAWTLWWPGFGTQPPSDAYLAELAVTPTAERIAGSDRYATAVEISKASFKDPQAVTSVLVATGQNFPDALAGSPLAGAMGCPILLTPTHGLTKVVRYELQRLNPQIVYVLGGPPAVGDDTFTQIEAALPSATVKRIEGADRYATGREIVEALLYQIGWSNRKGIGLVATGANFPDALAASPIAVSQQIPIFLAEPNGISSATIDMMKLAGVKEVYMLGSPDAVGQVTEDRLQTAFGLNNVQRLWGSDRYGTAVEVARFGVDFMPWTDWCGVTIATGQDFPDALSGGVLAGRRGTVMLMTPKESLAKTTKNALATYVKGTPRVTFFGSEAAVSGAVETQIVGAVD